MAYKIAVINQKGGVGKSTTAHQIGALLTRRGKKVLFIDLDPQGNLSFILGQILETGGAYDVLINPSSLRSNIIKTEDGDLVPSSQELVLADSEKDKKGGYTRIKSAVDMVNKEYDFIIIDTPPSFNIHTVNALNAVDGVVIPAQADILSLQGIGQLYRYIEPIKAHTNKSLKVLGILFTRFQGRGLVTRGLADEMTKNSKELNTKVFNTRIRECLAIKEAQVNRTNIYNYSKNSNASKDYEDFVNELLKEIKKG